MADIFLFNSPPRSGNVFLTHIFTMLTNEPSNKCLDIEKYSDKSQKQAAFFRNPYDSIPSTIVKVRTDSNSGFEGYQDLCNEMKSWANEYLKAIRAAKQNSEYVYIDKSENMMKDPIGAIKNIALFFGFEINNNTITNEEIVDEIKRRMENTQKTRVGRDGTIITETLMSSHDGHLPREKTDIRVYLDNLIKELDFDIVRECYNEYMSIETRVQK
jgi:hypothetical protein